MSTLASLGLLPLLARGPYSAARHSPPEYRTTLGAIACLGRNGPLRTLTSPLAYDSMSSGIVPGVPTAREPCVLHTRNLVRRTPSYSLLYSQKMV